MDNLKKKTGKTPLYTKEAFVLLWIIWAMNAVSRELINRLTPEIAATFDISASTLGIVSAAAQVVMSIGAIPLTMWADKGGVGWRRKKRSFVLALGYSIPLFLCGFLGMTVATGVFAVFVAANILRGLFNAAGESCEVGQMQEWVPTEKSGFYIGAHHSGYPWGTLLAGLLITAVVSAAGDNGWYICYMIFPVIGIVTWLIWLKFCNAERYENFQKECVVNGLTAPLGTEKCEEIEVEDNVFRKLLKNPNIASLFVIAFFHTMCYCGISYWLTPYLAFVMGSGAAAAASLSVVFTITGGIGQIFWGWFSDKLGTKTSLQITFVWLAVAFFLFRFVDSITGVIIVQLLFGCVINGIPAIMFKINLVSAPKGAATLANSIVTAGMYVGGAVATAIVGFAIDIGGGWNSMFGYTIGLMVLVFAALISALVITLFSREINGPRFGKDKAVVSMESCGLKKDKK